MLAESLAGLVAIEANDLVVTNPAGVVQVLGTDYEVTGTLRTGAGSIRALHAYTAGLVLTATRVTDLVQTAAIPVAGPLPSKTIELELDRRTLIEQEQVAAAAALAARTLLVPKGETIGLLPAKAARLGKSLGFDLVTGDPAAVDTGAVNLAGALAAQTAAAASAAGSAGFAAAGAISAAAAAASAAAAAGAASKPSETDNRPFEEMLPAILPSVRARLREIGRDNARAYVETTVPLRVGAVRNLWGFTEALGSGYYSIAGPGSAKQVDTLVIDGVTLTRLTTTNFYDAVFSNVGGLSLTPFIAGKMYCVSMYVLEHGADVRSEMPGLREKLFWMKDQGGGGGTNKAFAQRYATNRIRRTWAVGKATSTSQLDMGTNPTVAYGAGAGGNVFWFTSGQNGGTRNIYMGGFSIETIGDDTYKDGIALIGDSTVAGASGADDAIQYAEISAFVAASLNVTVFNRAVGGNKLSDMDARWAADITPLAVRCKYALIQGGINDIVTGRTLAQMQASMASMVTKAGTDGLIPVILTCTPTTSIAANPVYEQQRRDFNDGLRQTYPNVIDIAAVIEDPADRSKIRSDVDWSGDGVHYAYAAKRAVGAFIAAWPNWEFFQPGPYQKVAGAVGTYTPPAILLEGAAGQIIGQRGAAVADAAALTSANAVNAAAAPTAAEFNAFVAEFNKLRTDTNAVRAQLNTGLARLRAGTGHGLFA